MGKAAVAARAFAAALLLGAPFVALAAGEASTERAAAAMRARYAALERDPGHGQFQHALYLDSVEGETGVSGEIHALVGHSFAVTSAALGTPSQWCDVLILPLNTKYCLPGIVDGKRGLLVGIGRKQDQPMDRAYRLQFGYRVIAATASFLQVNLQADEGPLGTRDYRIVLAATPADEGRTLIRLSYSYAYGMAGRLAMEAYLGTLGRDKVGFTVVGRLADGQPRYIGGMRGVVERNSMRYYLAIEAFLGARASPAQSRAEKSFRDWFAAIERYPRQLHDLEQGEYLAMKRKEYLRQQPVAAPRAGAS
jgi:hypothetical protein